MGCSHHCLHLPHIPHRWPWGLWSSNPVSWIPTSANSQKNHSVSAPPAPILSFLLRPLLLAWGWQPSDHSCFLGCLDCAVRVITSRKRRKTAWTAELVEQITFQVPSGTAAFSTLVLASHNWIYPSLDNGSPGRPWRRGSRTRSLNGVLLGSFRAKCLPGMEVHT